MLINLLLIRQYIFKDYENGWSSKLKVSGIFFKSKNSFLERVHMHLRSAVAIISNVARILFRLFGAWVNIVSSNITT